MFLDHQPFVVNLTAAIREEAPGPIIEGAERTTHNSKASYRDDLAMSLGLLDDNTQDDMFSDDLGGSEFDGEDGRKSTSNRPTSALSTGADGRAVMKTKRSSRKFEKSIRCRKKRTMVEPKDIDSFQFLLNKFKKSGFAFRSRRAWLQELDTTVRIAAAWEKLTRQDLRDVSWEWLCKKYQTVFQTKMESLKRYNRPPTERAS